MCNDIVYDSCKKWMHEHRAYDRVQHEYDILLNHFLLIYSRRFIVVDWRWILTISFNEFSPYVENRWKLEWITKYEIRVTPKYD